ncbi:7194_t:CDS:10 [Diversispora eburnea]|uniref:7194_t:CDS:1 n=1 Tax=Diversispora eburnea TaxID=1213867 RepID=A0A9N9FJE2_9GLOM|nr:7194_t:CDS:10 [Diversispora eburnea]
MSEKDHSSSLNENDAISSGKSITRSIEKDFSFSGNYTAISPDSQQIVTFNPEKRELKLYDTDDLSSVKSTFTLKHVVDDNPLRWSIALSNFVCVDNENERLIALSCFGEKEFEIYDDEENDSKYSDDEEDLESGNKYHLSQTRVISATDGNEIYTSKEQIGGVVRFLDSDSDDSDQPLKNKAVIIIVNASGIYKETIYNIERKGFFSSKIDEFELPKQLSSHLRLSNDHWHNILELLHTSIIKNHFIVHSFENRQQFIEMYSLITGDLEILFKCHGSSVAPNIIYGSSIFATSQNEKILAFCRATSITLYSMENGLEITTKGLEGQGEIYKIIAINFIDNDSKLLIVLEEKKDQLDEILKRQIFVVWDLFSTFENSIRQIDYSEIINPLKMDLTYRLMNSHGKMFAVRDSGSIISVLDHKDVASIRNPPANVITKINLEKNTFDDQISIDNVSNMKFYLDSTKSTQLIISPNTIQVWKYRSKNIEKRDKRDRVLEYIWAQKNMINVQELRVGEREFVLKILVPPTKIITIHWPNNANVLEGACRSLYVLGALRAKKRSINSFGILNQIDYLIERTQRLVRKYITEYGIFRLTSIRYPIMKYLIKGHQDGLIKHILNVKINDKNCNIYIPRLYEWEDNNRTKILKSDLRHAISCVQKRKDSTVILKYLIDYYSDNAKEYNNYGWMFTVSEAIPSLYDNDLSEFVRYLFKKPCFGTTEAYTSPLHITSYDKKRGYNSEMMHSLVVKPCLASGFFYWFQTSDYDPKVYIVPLPDFTVYPRGPHPKCENYFWMLVSYFRILLWPRKKIINNTEEMSPFLRVIYEEKGDEIYRTPAIMAVLDFKWAAAPSKIVYLLEIESNIILKFVPIVYAYSGLYLITMEIMELKREGPGILYEREIVLQKSVYNSVLALTVLVLWLELILLMRYFVYPGRFIYIIKSILRHIWPFFAFMFIAIIAFGHAMFILINKDDSSLQIPTYRINDTSNSGLYSNITIYQDIDKSSRVDNYYSNLISSIEAVFFWINGRWDQLNQWDYPSVDLISILGSIILVLIFQNILIAFMNGGFEKANEESLTATFKFRAEFVAKYEALVKPSDNIPNQGFSSDLDIGKISFFDDEIFLSKVVTSKSNKKSHTNLNLKSSNESLFKDIGPTADIDERFNNLKNEFNTRFDELEQNLKTILKTLNNLNNPK